MDPERYGESAIEECGELDSGRTAADEILLQDAFNLEKLQFWRFALEFKP